MELNRVEKTYDIAHENEQPQSEGIAQLRDPLVDVLRMQPVVLQTALRPLGSQRREGFANSPQEQSTGRPPKLKIRDNISKLLAHIPNTVQQWVQPLATVRCE